MQESLAEFRSLVGRWSSSCVRGSASRDIWAQTDAPIKCSKHDVFENSQGCLICRDEPIG